MTEINHTETADRIATAQDFAAQSFEAVADSPFDEKTWREGADEYLKVERFVIAVMRMDDKELTAKVGESEESVDLFLEMQDMCGNLIEHHKDVIKATESAATRLLCVLTRLKLDPEVSFIADVDNEGEGGAS